MRLVAVVESTIVVLAEMKGYFRMFYKIITDINLNGFFKKNLQ